MNGCKKNMTLEKGYTRQHTIIFALRMWQMMLSEQIKNGVTCLVMAMEGKRNTQISFVARIILIRNNSRSKSDNALDAIPSASLSSRPIQNLATMSHHGSDIRSIMTWRRKKTAKITKFLIMSSMAKM